MSKKSTEELVKIFEDTVNCIKVGGYNDNSGKWHDLTNPVQGSKLFKTLPNTKDVKKKQFETTKIYVQNIDTLLKARELGPRCAALNMASYYCPGGGVAKGSRAQEEDLCRRSNLIESLYNFTDKGRDEFNITNKETIRYPIPMYGGLYSPNITVFKSNLSYSKLDEPFTCSIISVAALKRPALTKDGLLNEKDATTMKGKIRAILRIAMKYKHYKLVLGALGCGAYGNPPSHIAKLFKEVLEEDEFIHSFEEICFAILEDANSLNNREKGNIKPFKDVFR
jgi:uncharacterized protein (TIGR02452 family)